MSPQSLDAIMITHAPAPSCHADVAIFAGYVDEDGRKMCSGSVEFRNHSERMFHAANGHPPNGDAMPSSLNSDGHKPAFNGKSNGQMNSVGDDEDRSGISEQRTTRQEHQNSDHGETRQIKKRPPKEPLHKMLYENFRSELTSLREVTKEALQISCQEEERLCLKGEELEARISCLRTRIRLANGKLTASGSLGGEMEEALRLSLVKEGEDEKSSIDALTKADEGWDSPEKSPTPKSTMKRINSTQGALQANLASKRFNARSSALHGSQSTKGSNISDATGIPHMSRSSLLGMLGASKTWLDHYAGPSNENNEESAKESAPVYRLSFVGGAGDGMPSRWRAREQEREKSEKQKEVEERRSQRRRASIDYNKENGGEATTKSTYSPTMEEKLQKLISRRERDISSLEARASSVVEQTSSLHCQIDVLNKDERQAQEGFQCERTKLLDELDQVQSDNYKLDHMVVETGVISDEKKIGMEILANELKAAREELAFEQNERDGRRAEQKKRDRARRWSWMRGAKMEQQPEPTKEKKKKEKPARYQVPTDAMHQYQTFTSYSSGTESSGDGFEQRRLADRRQSTNSVMSSLTLDSADLVDILAQLDLDE